MFISTVFDKKRNIHLKITRIIGYDVFCLFLYKFKFLNTLPIVAINLFQI